MTSFKKVVLEVNCGGHVSERTFLNYLNQIDFMADKVFDGRVVIISTLEKGQPTDDAIINSQCKLAKMYDENYYLKQILIALDNHSRKHGMISRLLFAEILNVGLAHSGIIIEGLND